MIFHYENNLLSSIMSEKNVVINFPQIMGIINVTPDSFSDGGKFIKTDNAIKHGLALIEDGADIIDVGGESTRPGAESVTEEEELKRVIPLIKELKRQNPNIKISIDTTKFIVAKAALDEGAEIINDISGLTNDIRLAELARNYNASIILMHLKGTPQTMQQNPSYENVTNEIFEFLKERIELARNHGVKSIIADVGIGFGKNLEHNLELLRNIDVFKRLKVPLCLGISRKAFIGNILGIETPSDRDVPTALIHALLLSKNIDIIRVHNFAMIIMLKKLWEVIKI